MDPYLPDIMAGVVARVSTAFQARATDPFEVFFEHGLYSQVARNVYKDGNFPLIWLVMPFRVTRGDYKMYGDTSVDLHIIMPTDNKYSQQQRDDLSYKPRLLPIYEVLLQEIARERWFSFKGVNQVQHTQIIRPYWGGADVNGQDIDNLFKKNVDTLTISGLKLSIKHENCAGSKYPINTNTDYQPSKAILAFFDDLELVVDGGAANDPVAGADSVVIEFLKGKKYDVIQRAFGQLRRQRDVEVLDDADNGGFSLTNGKKFNTGDSYFIKLRPMYVNEPDGQFGTTVSGTKTFFVGEGNNPT